MPRCGWRCRSQFLLRWAERLSTAALPPQVRHCPPEFDTKRRKLLIRMAPRPSGASVDELDPTQREILQALKLDPLTKDRLDSAV